MTRSAAARGDWWDVLRGRQRAAAAAEDPGPPTPLTRSRITRYLDSHEFSYAIDDDGDPTGSWEGNLFWFLCLGRAGEILQVRGRWDRTLPLAQRSAARLVLNDWNRDRIWPKVYSRVEDDELAVYAEVSADLEAGADDAQLRQLLDCGLSTCLQFFAQLDLAVPRSPDAPD